MKTLIRTPEELAWDCVAVIKGFKSTQNFYSNPSKFIKPDQHLRSNVR